MPRQHTSLWQCLHDNLYTGLTGVISCGGRGAAAACVICGAERRYNARCDMTDTTFLYILPNATEKKERQRMNDVKEEELLLL